MSSDFERLRDLRTVLVRLGARPVASYWASPFKVFASNFFGGTVAGAIVLMLAAVFVGLDVHRGRASFAIHVIHAVQLVATAIRTLTERSFR